MKPYAAAILAFGVLSIALGIVGATGVAGGEPSMISLIAGGGIGAIMVGMAFLAKDKPGIAYRVAAVVCLLVMGQFGRTAFTEGRWNAVTMFVAGLLLFLYLGYGHMASKKSGHKG